jgi:RNA polymerase sigma-70 factor (sigma-E family)
MMRVDVRQPERLEGGRLGELYVRYAPGAVRLAYLLTGDRALSEDLVQDAFVKLAGRFIDFREPHGFDAYLRTTVVNLARVHFRHRKVERAYLKREGGRSVPETQGPDFVTREPLREALYGLSERQRAAIVLRFYEDLSEAQTAEILGCRPGTVKSLVSRGMETLRRAMGDA